MPSTTIELTSADEETFEAYLATPDAANGAGIVLLQEIFGVNSNMRATADSYAAEGYHVIVPDLFWRQERGVELDPGNEADRERAAELLKGLDQILAVEDSLIAADYLRNVPGNSGKIGAVGYCLGGKLAYLMATRDGIDVAVSYYGVLIQSALEQIPNIRCQLLLHIACDDHLCPQDAQASIIDAAASRSEIITVLTYPHVGHAFARRGSAVYNSEAAKRADAATLALLNKDLRLGF